MRMICIYFAVGLAFASSTPALTPAQDTTMPKPDHDDDTDAHALPCPQAMLAGTLALMSAWAHPVAGCALHGPQRRPVLARKIISNLFFLEQHPLAGPAVRGLAGQLHRHWAAAGAGPSAGDGASHVPGAAADASPLWH